MGARKKIFLFFFKMQKEKRRRAKRLFSGKAATGRTLHQSLLGRAPTVGLSLSRSPTIRKRRETPLEADK